MINRTKEEIEDFLLEVWDKDFPEKVDIDITPNYVAITLSSMYRLPGLSFAKLMALSAFFDTKNINDADRFSYGGCETCDYGSKYGFTLTIKPD